MKKHWSTISGLPVVLPEEEERALGRLNGVFMDPEKAQVIGFLVGYSKVLVPIEIEKWRENCVQVGDREALAPLMEILRIEQFGLRRTFLNGKRVLSKSGRPLGRVRDFTFETTTSAVVNIEVSKRFLWLEWANRIFLTKDILEVTERAIILNVEPEKTVKAAKPVRAPLAT